MLKNKKRDEVVDEVFENWSWVLIPVVFYIGLATFLKLTFTLFNL